MLRCLLPALLLLQAARAQTPDVVLEGTVTRADYQTYREVPFVVPEGTARVSVEFSYTGRDQATTIDLGLLDPHGFRGWSGGNKRSFTVAESDATPSYLPGRIEPGRWALLLGIPNIRDGVQSTFTARVFFQRKGSPPPVSTFSNAPLHDGPAWYRGDLHLHTAHSDGSCRSQSGTAVPCPLFRTLETAAARGLDFLAITDHNTTSHYDALRELQPYFDRLLLLPGAEVTTFYGHANVFGTTEHVDFRLGSATVPSIGALLDQVQALHALISINHPAVPSGESCMGCGWTAAGTDFQRVQAIEVRNGSTADEAGVRFWEDLLNRGFRVTGIGGSDDHGPGAGTAATRAPGTPTTVVYAENLSEQGILDGIRRGHAFIDTEGTKNRMLTVSAQAGSHAASMGDVLPVARGERVRIAIQVTAARGALVEFIEDGRVVALLQDPLVPTDDAHLTAELPVDGAKHWLRVNVRAPDGRLLLIGNPIHLSF